MEELFDLRLSRLHRRFQRLLQFRCCAHVDASLTQLLLGKSICVHVRV
jgi:hypothetical protein